MNASFRAGLLAGLIPGLALSGVVYLLMRPAAEPVKIPAGGPAPASPLDPAALREENRRLKENLALALSRKAAPVEETKKEEKPAEPAPDLKKLYGELMEIGIGPAASQKFGEVLKAVKAGGKPAVDFVINALRTSSSATERLLAASLLEAAADPSAIPALAETLKGDPDETVRRAASHAIALLGTESADVPLRAAMTGDADWGVRANSAYGMAKRNDEQGLRILREIYESPQTPAEYRLPVLGGLADVGAPSTAPLFRQILTDTKDTTYLLLSMSALAKMKDAEAIPLLQRIQDSTQPDLIKQSAAKTIEAIRK